jgi:hypothetical protein
MYALIRKNQRPSFLRHVVRGLRGCEYPPLPAPGALPSHHILCAGTYSPVFARLAAECALAACPPALRQDFHLYIHVDGLAARQKPDLMAWLGEIPGATLSYGLFGILPQDRIPGKWHQTMINDVVELFQAERHLAFVDADLFLVDDSWWSAGLSQLADDVYAVTVGLRRWATMTLDGCRHCAQTTNLFTLNTAAHRAMERQQCNKDRKAMRRLRRDYPQAEFSVERVDSLVVSSLRAQAQGLKVHDVEDRVTHCHVGGFSHLGFHKFHSFEAPERRPVIESLLGRFRLLSAVLDYFDGRGWGRFVETGYRDNVARTWAFIRERPLLVQLLAALPPTPHEQVFARVVQAHA